MTLTLSHGPLSADPPRQVNYDVRGPKHRLLLDDFPRRVRAQLDGETVADTRRGKLLHETGLLPQLYVPSADVRAELLEPSDHSTHCPFKGDAAYWSVRAGDRLAQDAIWAYPQPLPEAEWLRGYQAIFWERMDGWLDEDEVVLGHLRDPYHRVDARRTAVHVRVVLDDEAIADTHEARVLSETGLANRFYIPVQNVDRERLEPSDKTTVCPYKGTATYHSLRRSAGRLEDAAWSYPDPLEDARAITDHLSFDHPELQIEADGRPAG